MTPRDQIIAIIGEDNLTALESSGYMVRPVEATEGMLDAGEKEILKCSSLTFRNEARDTDTAMTQHWLTKEMNGE